MIDYLESLNDKQIEAVKETEGYVRVIAGAGSGKTKVLISRYIYLIDYLGINPSNILCITFTNKAAQEMKKRIKNYLGNDFSTNYICTYHGFCANILRENPEKLLLNKNFQIIDISQQKAILAEIYEKRQLKLDHASFENILKKITEVKTSPMLSYVRNFCRGEKCQILDTITTIDDEIIEEYIQKQKAMYSLDFNDLISFVLYLFRKDDEIKNKWANRLNYVLVDEFQDTSNREYELLNIISSKYNNLMVVGDPDQNIYEWRGSKVELLVNFEKYHIGTKTIFLNQNYRSTPQILNCANSLIDKNQFRIKKDLFTKNPNGNTVVYYHFKSTEDENKKIVELIKESKKNGYKYSDTAILFRSSFLSRVVEKKLLDAGIPYDVYDGVRFFERMEVKDIIAYLKLLAFDDDNSFKRIINTPRRKFGKVKMQILEDYIQGHESNNQFTFFSKNIEENKSMSLFQTLKENYKDKRLYSKDIDSFIQMIEKFRDNIHKAKISDIVNDLLAESNYEKYIRELGDNERLDNLAEFKRMANEFESSFGDTISLEEYLQYLALQIGDTKEQKNDCVKLMTIHSSKGLEFPVVFIIGMTQGIFPSSKSIDLRGKQGLEEERRLCYVAITRAEKQLYLMDSEGLTLDNKSKYPSCFLKDIDEKNYTRIGEYSDYITKQETNNLKVENINLSNYRNIGDLVYHHVFGNGKIIAVNKLNASYVVKFENLNQIRNISKPYFDNFNISTIKKYDETMSLKQNNAPENYTKPSKNIVKVENVVNISKNNSDFNNARNLGDSNITNLDNTPIDKITRLEKNKIISPHTRKLHNDISNIPQEGWYCIGMTDVKTPSVLCQYCGEQYVRYVHHMVHNTYGKLNVGCVCAGTLTHNI